MTPSVVPAHDSEAHCMSGPSHRPFLVAQYHPHLTRTRLCLPLVPSFNMVCHPVTQCHPYYCVNTSATGRHRAREEITLSSRKQREPGGQMAVTCSSALAPRENAVKVCHPRLELRSGIIIGGVPRMESVSVLTFPTGHSPLLWYI